ncbi:Lactase-phlorizin hydrolase [Folsomia candida]|uniref:Lactase-phlorizin hydrolase n=1 Tax=Folsomia candida TaxID=158441 RepID=A0A226DU03_FOLCA|nr:Lactase-phlorizin hydrolase [Folsomia candida]
MWIKVQHLMRYGHQSHGTYDFWGLNHYSTFLVEPSKSTEPGNSTRRARPLTRLLTWINWRYRHGEIYVLENGYAETRGRGLEDYDRVAYHQAYINEMLKAVILDGVNVRVYTAWSLLDQFEYTFGHTTGFGVSRKLYRPVPNKDTQTVGGMS